MQSLQKTSPRHRVIRRESLAANASARGFSLLELLLVIMILAVIGVMVIPVMQHDARVHVMAATELVVSDLEYAQQLNIADPGVPIVMVIDESGGSYHLALASTQGTPIIRPDTDQPYVVTFGEGRARSVDNVTLSMDAALDGMIVFDSLGAPSNADGNIALRVQSGDRWIDIIISAATGMIRTVADNEQ